MTDRRNRFLRCAAGLAVLFACLSGCVVDYDSPVADGGAQVKATPYVGVWMAQTFAQDPKFAAGGRLVVSASGANGLKLHATSKSGQEFNFEGRLADVSGTVFLSIRRVAPGQGRREPWMIARLRIEDAGRRLIATDLSPIAARKLVDAGEVEGGVYEAGIMTEYTVGIEGDSSETRKFVSAHATKFIAPFAEFERSSEP